MAKTGKEIGDRPPLDRWRADAVLEPNRPIWGLNPIAKFLGVSQDTVRRLAKKKGVPIHRPEGASGYFAFRSDLIRWLKGEQANDLQGVARSCHLPERHDDAA